MAVRPRRGLACRPAERALLIKGDPGIGKIAVVAELVQNNPGGQVLAYHCCQADNPETTSPARFVQNLAFQLAGQLAEYAALVKDQGLDEALGDDNCLANPMGASKKPSSPRLAACPPRPGGLAIF